MPPGYNKLNIYSLLWILFSPVQECHQCPDCLVDRVNLADLLDRLDLAHHWHRFDRVYPAVRAYLADLSILQVH